MSDTIQIERRWQASANTAQIGQTFASDATALFGFVRAEKAFRPVMVTPQQYRLDRLPLEHYRLAQPILLDVTIEDGLTIVSDGIWNQFGAGETLKDAVAEYGSMLVEYFEELAASEEVLAPHLRLQLKYLSEVLVAC